jgi:hypothetical protein
MVAEIILVKYSLGLQMKKILLGKLFRSLSLELSADEPCLIKIRRSLHTVKHRLSDQLFSVKIVKKPEICWSEI